MLVQTLLDSCNRCPSKLAVDDGTRSLTYRQLTLLARVFRDVVLRETSCERVGIMLPAGGAFPALLLGVHWANRVAVPLNFLLAAKELTAVVADAGLDLVITVHHFKSLCQQLGVRALYLEELSLRRHLLFAMLRRWPRLPVVDQHATAVLLYTSGTTGEPKGVELTHGNLLSNTVDSIEALQLDRSHRFLNILPPFHVFGLTACVAMPIVAGASVFAQPRFNPLAAIKAVSRQKITALMAIPSMYAAMLRSKSATAEDFASLRIAISGGEPLPASVRTGFRERFGVALHEGYGLTETSPVVSVNSAQSHRDGSVGRLIRNVEVRFVGPEGQILPQGQEGEIAVRGPGIMKGYYRKPEMTRGVLSEDGWFSTGDLGRIDSDGFLFITGRVKDMLIVGGENVYAREIEAALEAHEAVLQAAVIGIPADTRGEVPVAFVIPKLGQEVTEESLRTFARKSLAGFKVPRRIEIRTELPTGPTGKILKRKLRELL
ncbi:MAG: AMP-binding protein [Planctomycetota bacterium]